LTLRALTTSDTHTAAASVNPTPRPVDRPIACPQSETIRRRESKDGPRFDVEWRLPDRTKRSNTFKSEREARVFEASLVTKFAAGDIMDPRPGRITLAAVYRSWLASRLDLSPKVRRGYQDNWRNRIESRFGEWHAARIDHHAIQTWVNEMAESGLSPRTVRWVHSVLKMSLDYAIDDGLLPSRNPAARTKFPPRRHTSHIYLSTREVAALALPCGPQGDVVTLLAYTGGLRFRRTG
jgi:integrase